MPGFITHYFFGQDVLKTIDNKQLKYACTRYHSLFILGLQGPDIFFYHLPSLLYKDARNIGSFLHENRTNMFFNNCFSELQKKTFSDRKLLLPYVCGFICHYALDSCCHPFIFARTNYKPDISGKEYLGTHSDIENAIDAIFLKSRKGIPLAEFRQYPTYKLKAKEKNTLCIFLSSVIAKTCNDIYTKLNYTITPRFIHHVLSYCVVESKFLVDPYGRKKKIIATIEDIIFPYHLLSDKFITNSNIPIKDPLNLSNDTWTNPWEIRLKSNSNFYDEYEKALLFVNNIFNTMNSDIINNPESFVRNNLDSLLLVLENRSYHSGLPSNT